MIGIDTIHLRVPVDLSGYLREKQWRHTIYSAGQENESERWEYQSKIHPSIYCIYHALSYARVPALIIKVSSLSRLAFANNFTAFVSVNDAIQTLASALNDDPWIPRIEDLSSAFLVRLDIYGHYQIGEENVYRYLDVLSKSNYPHRTRISYQNPSLQVPTTGKDNGVAFCSKSVTSRFYAKYQQSKDPGALGLLRHEIQFSTSGAISNAFGIDSAIYSSVNENACNQLLLRDLQVLHLVDNVVGIHLAESMLIGRYGNSYGMRLLDLMKFIYDHPELSIEQVALQRGRSIPYTKRQIYQIGKVGISPELLDSDELVPPLVLEHLLPAENRKQVVSDTRDFGG